MDPITQIKPADSRVGKCAPDFTSRLTKGELSMSAYEGSWTLLFCHPDSFTPVCTTEFIELARRKPEFDALGVEIIGLSVDSVYSRINWLEWIKSRMDVKVEFPVIEDMSMQVARAYGMIDANSRNLATVRACYLIDPEQIVQAVILYPMYIGRSIEELLHVQRALIDTYRNNLSTPADWQPGDKYLETALDMETLQSDEWLSSAIKGRVDG